MIRTIRFSMYAVVIFVSCDDELAEALKHLSERNRENLLMYYFLEMSDTEIAKRQNISRSGVFQNRHNSLELMKKILKEK